MVDHQSSIDGLNFGQEGLDGPDGRGVMNQRMTSRTLRILKRVLLILMIALGLWCVSMGCKVLPMFARPLIDGMPDSISKDALLHVMDGCDVVHVYTWKLFGWMEPTAARLWSFVVGLWSRFIGWVNTLPYNQPPIG